MADFSFLDALGSIAENAASYFIGQQQQKQAIKLAKAGASQLPRLGMGYGAESPSYPLPGGVNVGGPYGVTMGDYLPSQVYAPGTSVAAMNDVTAGGSSTARMIRRPSIIQGPDGRLYRTLGRPLLWSGDLAAFKRVRKIAGKLRSYAGHRSFR